MSDHYQNRSSQARPSHPLATYYKNSLMMLVPSINLIIETLKSFYDNDEETSIFHKSNSTQYYTTLDLTSLYFTSQQCNSLLYSTMHTTAQHPNTPNKSKKRNKPLFFFSCIQILILLQQQKKVRDLEFVKRNEQQLTPRDQMDSSQLRKYSKQLINFLRQ